MPTVLISDNAVRDFTGTLDCEMNESLPTTNNGAATDNEVFSWAAVDRGHTLIEFTGLSNITGPVTVTAATLELNQESATGSNTRTIEIYRCLRDWVEAEATWDIYSTGNSWTTGGCLSAGNDYNSTLLATADITTALEYKTWTFNSNGLQAIQDWINGVNPNYGFMLIRNSDTAYDATSNRFSSSEGADTIRPKLTVTYTTGPAPRIIVPTIAVQMR